MPCDIEIFRAHLPAKNDLSYYLTKQRPSLHKTSSQPVLKLNMTIQKVLWVESPIP